MRRNAKGALKESGYVSGRTRSGPSSLISDNRVRWPKSVDGIVGSRCISRRGLPFSLGWKGVVRRSRRSVLPSWRRVSKVAAVDLGCRHGCRQARRMHVDAWM